MNDPKLDLWLVRHGETTWNAEGRWQGQTDVPLSELGRDQAQRLAKRLEGTHFDTVISSDLGRALETARVVAAKLRGAPEVQTDPRWREINVGALSGLTASGLGHWVRPFDERCPDGESKADLALRTAHALTDLAREQAGRRVIVFAHGGTIKSAFGVLFGDLRTPFWSSFGHLSNTGISRFQVWLEELGDADEGDSSEVVRGRLVSFNDVAHLETNFVFFDQSDPVIPVSLSA
jgi:2,3-bisphosphoglycerate-dependent phosphoglycerate mutase